MKKINLFLFFFLTAATAFYACMGQGGHAVKGTITSAGNLEVLLEQSHFDRSNVALGRVTSDANGNFEIKQDKAFEQGIYRITIGAKRLYFILDGTENVVEITGELNTIDRLNIQVKGSETFTCYAGIISDIFKNQLKSPEEARGVIKKGCNPLMQAFLTTSLLGSQAGAFLDDFKTASKALAEYMPGSKYAADYATMISTLESQLAQQQQPAQAIKVGTQAPEISLPGPDGKNRSLSNLKGKIVLLDFWASWCGPCRRENPHVVEVYKKYKDKGFDVFSVSLDKQDGKDKWMDAIKKDGLIWDNHVSDLQFWNSAPAGVYGVRSIPQTFLIGRDGKIIAVNPRETLEEELKKVL
ncbi:MAG: TlpA family protein disulfide reductase [Saprospiraceae bacterium]|nr:TlpA family protein disulfide reductase [Saprospiraceae bacterium]